MHEKRQSTFQKRRHGANFNAVHLTKTLAGKDEKELRRLTHRTSFRPVVDRIPSCGCG
jgi:hypothetical protein